MAAGSGESPRTPADTTRRGFYVIAINAMMAVITALLGVPAIAYLFGPVKPRDKNQWIDIGDVSRLSAGEPVELTGRRNRADGWKVVSERVTAWVMKKDNAVVAFGPQCTHLGCAYHWDQARNEFVCPCHDSLFSLDGSVVSGPAPRPLDRYDVKIEGNRLLLGELRRAKEPSV